MKQTEAQRLADALKMRGSISYEVQSDAAALLLRQDELLRQALDAFAFAYNSCESEWVQDEKIDPVMNAIRNHREAK